MSIVGLPADAVAAFTDRVLAEIQATAPDLAARIRPLRAQATEPPRILVTGGPGTGVSTLVRALVGEAGQVSVGGAGSGGAGSAGADVSAGGSDTSVLWCTADRPVPEDVPVGVRVRQVAGAALRNLTLIDASGMCDNEASTCADAVVYLVDREPSVADRERIRQLGAGPAGTVLVVSRADEFGSGSLGSADPVADARGYARALAEDTASWAAAVAVSPLLATAARVLDGAADGDAGADATGTGLADRLASYRSPAVAAGLLGTEIPPVMTADLQLVGTYGILHGGAAVTGCTAATGGTSGTDARAALTQWLTDISGIDDLHTVLLGRLAQAALLRRCARILDEVGQLRFTASDPAAVSAVLDRAGAAPEAWRIRLFPDIARLAEAGLDAEAALVARVVDADGLHDLARVPAGSSQVSLLNGLREQLRTANLQLTGFTVPVVEAALTAVSVVLRRAIGEVETALAGGVSEIDGVTDGTRSLFG